MKTKEPPQAKNSNSRVSHAERMEARLKRRAQVVEDAKRTLEDEDCPIQRLKAQHVLVEEEILVRIDEARKELKETRTKHREELRALRRKSNSTLARSRRRLDETFISTTKKLIKSILKKYLPVKQLNIDDILQAKLEKKSISYGLIADTLNEQDHQTAYGRIWTRSAVKRFIELYMEEWKVIIGLDEDRTKPAIRRKRQKVEEFAAMMRDEVLPLIDTSQKPHVIAEILNKRGFKTRLGSNWGNMAVKRLLDTIEKLEE